MSNKNLEIADKQLWDELWGCVNYLKIPFETVMSMPVYIRKFWILKHNETVNKENAPNSGKTSTIDGQSINAYAQIEQGNRNTPK